MALELLTITDLKQFKSELFLELRALLQAKQDSDMPLKSREVCRLLRISPGTLQTLKRNGTLRPIKIGGTHYFRKSDVQMLFNKKAGP